MTARADGSARDDEAGLGTVKLAAQIKSIQHHARVTLVLQQIFLPTYHSATVDRILEKHA